LKQLTFKDLIGEWSNMIKCSCGHYEEESDIHGVYSTQEKKLIDFCEKCWSEREDIYLNRETNIEIEEPKFKDETYIFKG